MGELIEERGGEVVKMENSVIKLSPQMFTPGTEEALTKFTTQLRSTRESTMTDETDGIKKEAKSESPDSETKFGRGMSTMKMSRRTPPLFSHLPSATEEATKTFTVIQDSIYTAKYLGDSGQDEAMSCDCRSSWIGSINEACGEDSDCINRLTSMECFGTACGCGADCQNQRFQNHQYADVDVILTEMKGYGIRINRDTPANTFIYEYVGEVIDEAKFRRRTEQYAKEGIKHFYFMSLGKSEFIDATRKGGLGRFCNHSCNPNCYVDKWVVGDKLRMGIFAKRNLKAGEELVFDYNVDRYGADPQACYCGEPNCIGYIGGKTQTEAGTKLSHQTLEALGLDDDYSWSTVTAKKKKPKKGEIDDDYVQSIQPKALEASTVNGIMSSLVSCKEKWIVIKLLNRIHASEDPLVQGRVLRLHGYSIMNNLLVKWRDEKHIIITILEILAKWPRLTKNKISSSKIEGTVEEICQKNEDAKVQELSRELLESWACLQSAYRIPRRAPGVENAAEFSFDEGRRQREKSPTPSDRPSTPKQPRNSAPAKPFNPPKGPANATPAGQIRQPINQPPPPPPPSIPTGHIMPASTNGSPLPRGWWWHKDPRGVKFFYTSDYSKIQWNHPLDPSIFPQTTGIIKRRGLDDIIQACQQEYAETAEAKMRADIEKKALEEEERHKREEERRKYEEERRERKRKEHEAKKLKKKKEDKFKSIEPELARKLIAKTHGVIAFEVANVYRHKYKWNWPKDDFKLLMKGFSYKLADRTLEKGGKYAEQPGIAIDKEYRGRIEGHVKQWMKDERYCKKKLEQFRKEYAQPGTDGESPVRAKLGGSSSQPSVSQPGSSGGTEDSPMVNGVNDVKVGADEGSAKSTPTSSFSPRKRNREDEDGEAGGDSQEMDQSPRKRSKSGSPAYVESPPGSAASQRMETSVQPDSLPQSPGVAEVLQLSLPVMGTPIKREREEDDGDEDIEMKDGSEERVIKKVRSRSNSPSRGFEDEMKRQPAVVHTGA